MASRFPFQGVNEIGGADNWPAYENRLSLRELWIDDPIAQILIKAFLLASSFGKVIAGRGSFTVKIARTEVRIRYVPHVRAGQGTHALQGRVLDSTGTPLELVRVTLDSPVRRSAISDDRGYFSFSDLEMDRYLISAHHPGFIPKSATVNVSTPRTVLSLVLSPARM